MRQLYVIILLFISTGLHAQQTGILKGKIISRGNPVPFANVFVDGTSIGTTATIDGEFTLEKIPVGKQIIHFRLIGYQTKKLTLQVKPGQNDYLEVNLLEDNLDLGETVVSATRYDLDRSQAPVVVNVLSNKIFKATQSISISEGLNYQPGVRMETNCQNCGFTQVRMNGLEGAYSQILVNSRAVFSALNSVYGLDQIPTNMVERIEVVRSGGSALFGSNAIAGTINIITKDPVENLWEIGSNFAIIGGKALDNSVNFNGSFVSEDLSNGVTFYGMTRKRESYDHNGDGFTELPVLENYVIGTKFYVKPSDRSKLTIDLNAVQEHRRGGNSLDLPPPFTDITEQLDHRTYIIGATFDQFSVDRLTKTSFYVSSQNTTRESYYGGLGGGRTKQDSTTAANAFGNTTDIALVAGAQASRSLKNNDMVVVGIENQYSKVDDEIKGYNRTINQRVNSLGLYGQYEWKPINSFTALLGGRYDLVTVEGNYTLSSIHRKSELSIGVFSPRFTMLYDIAPTLQFRGGYARGFRAPQAFNEDLHVSSVGGEPQFVILSDDLKTEFSNAYSGSFNFTRNFGDTQVNLLLEGFYTALENPFTIVSAGAILPNGSILGEVQNGSGARVSGGNFQLSASPSREFTFVASATLQRSKYIDPQILFSPEEADENEHEVTSSYFVRSPNSYGYFTGVWNPSQKLGVDLTGTYTGSMIVPLVVSETGFMELRNSPAFYDMNLKVSYHLHLAKNLNITFSAGAQNIFNSYQDDFQVGPTRDSDYVYGPAKPRTFFVGITIGNSK
ncbi:outer membrane receptor for ferrienterochelin and colicins [Algoriphagus sp. 4150]|uniref:TonB-dependent receptor n=1 Tax=Algoriphagus sp. 4150 TaxID=2817756 RepID=UPI002860FCA9|nr:TonB-dependent receptor [Algoriphagus sp. 4150]MDR7131246.1 outer membrane receptor for ferrienterochelin and colicins [Algoriphagus sp. 4150]